MSLHIDPSKKLIPISETVEFGDEVVIYHPSIANPPVLGRIISTNGDNPKYPVLVVHPNGDGKDEVNCFAKDGRFVFDDPNPSLFKRSAQ